MKNWHKRFDEHQLALIRDCGRYASGDAAGMPAHDLALIIAKFNETSNMLEW